MIKHFAILVFPLTLLLLADTAVGQQTCKYDSIVATAPTYRFTDNGDGTATDRATGLMWKRCSEGQTWDGTTCTGAETFHNWQQALQLADGPSYAGYTDWRLPSVQGADLHRGAGVRISGHQSDRVPDRRFSRQFLVLLALCGPRRRCVARQLLRRL